MDLTSHAHHLPVSSRRNSEPSSPLLLRHSPCVLWACVSVSLIPQWIAELREKSTRPLKILSYHGVRPKDPRDLVDFDVVISAYSILSTESGALGTRSKSAAIAEPWAYEGPAGLCYSSPLMQVHWRRIILDESQSVKNAASECSQQASKLLGRCRYLMSGTPFGNSLQSDTGAQARERAIGAIVLVVAAQFALRAVFCVLFSDLKGQAKFLGMVGFVGSFLWGELLRFMASQQRYTTLQAKVKPDDHDGVPFLTMEWLKRFRNIFTWLCTRSMMRHEKGLLFRGRASLLVLPQAIVQVVPVKLTPTQRAAYKVRARTADESRSMLCSRFSFVLLSVCVVLSRRPADPRVCQEALRDLQERGRCCAQDDRSAAAARAHSTGVLDRDGGYRRG